MTKATKSPRAPAVSDAAVRELKDLHGGASIYDVAEQADVSIVTVSRVFNDYPHVSERMRERVFMAARRVGYTPRLVSKRNVLAAIVGHLDHLSAGDYKTRLLLHIVRVAAKNGYLVEFIPYDSVELATKHLVNGMVEVGLTGDEVARLTNLPKVPKVAINKQPADAEWNSVSSDHYREAQMAVEHLGAKGHRRIALVLDEPKGWGVERRRRGYEEALEHLGDAAFAPLVFCSSDTSSEQIARRIRDAHCTACVNLTDNYGFAVVDAFTNGLGMRVPDDISMVCLENEAVSPFLHPRLTTVAQPLETIAETAVNGIIEQLRGRRKRFAHIVESRLIDRDSVATLA
jgi:LacI family transcriptional regulator